MDQPHVAVPSGPPKARDPWLDNTRLVAAVLIVVMHVCGQAMARSDVLYELWYASWPLRVPLFVLVAGFFSSADPLRGRRAVALLRNVLGVYLLADLVASVVSWLTGGGWEYTPVHAPFALWFLLSLFWWRAMLPLVAHVKHLGVISVAASVAVGFVPTIGHGFSASRTIAFFPLFLLGWYLRRTDVRALLDRTWVRGAAWLALVGVGLAAATVAPRVSRSMYTFRDAYPHSGFVEQLPYAGVRAALLVYGVVGAVALLTLMPRRRLPVLTYLGTGSMYIYVIHALVVDGTGFRETAWYHGIDTVPEMLGLIGLAVVGALALASPPVRWVARWLIQPRYTWPFRDEVPETPPLGKART